MKNKLPDYAYRHGPKNELPPFVYAFAIACTLGTILFFARIKVRRDERENTRKRNSMITIVLVLVWASYMLYTVAKALLVNNAQSSNTLVEEATNLLTLPEYLDPHIAGIVGVGGASALAAVLLPSLRRRIRRKKCRRRSSRYLRTNGLSSRNRPPYPHRNVYHQRRRHRCRHRGYR